MGEHFRRGILLARRIGIARGDDMGFGHGQRDAVGDRIGGSIGGGDTALALAASANGSFAFTACPAFTFACGCRGGRRCARLAACGSPFAPGLAATGSKQPARKCGAEAELGPEFKRAVHGMRCPWCKIEAASWPR